MTVILRYPCVEIYILHFTLYTFSFPKGEVKFVFLHVHMENSSFGLIRIPNIFISLIQNIDILAQSLNYCNSIQMIKTRLFMQLMGGLVVTF